MVRALWLLLLYFLTMLVLSAGLLGFIWQMRHLVDQHFLFFLPEVLGLVMLAVLWWAALPRFWVSAVPDGVLVDLQTEPELRLLIAQTAQTLEVPVPDEVRLLPDMNAYASERGWYKPVRTLGLGLPLLELLSRDELQGVIAHELGHLGYGDAAGTWRLSAAQQSLLRTATAVQQVSRLQDSHSVISSIYYAAMWLLSIPLLAIARAYLNTYMQLSHLKELRADALAAHHFGRSTVAAGLSKIALNAHLFDVYCHTQVAPLVAEGWRVPLVEGFSQYVQSPEAQKVRQLTQQRSPPDEPSLSHPSLKNRLESLPTEAATTPPETPADSVKLFGAEVWADGFYSSRLKVLKRASWQELNDVYWPQFYIQQLLHPDAQVLLASLHLSELPTTLGDFYTFLRPKLLQLRCPRVGEERAYAQALIATGVAVRLHAQGWRYQCVPGHQIALTKGKESLVPQTLVEEMVRSAEFRQTWPSMMQRLGLDDAPLMPANR